MTKIPATAGIFLCLYETEKGRETSTLFIPNLTINLTYLCYGSTKILVLREITKKIPEKNTKTSEKYYVTRPGFRG
jgi:hypothetical protein